MRKIILSAMLVLALIFGYTAAKSIANDLSGEGLEMMQETQKPLGAIVKNQEGEFLGVITDFASEPDDRISFAIILFGKDEDYGEGGREVAIPFGTLSCDGQDCLLASNYDQLASSPVFITKDELVNREFAENIYRYYGLQPPWTEEESTEHEMSSEESTEYEMSPDVPSDDYDY
jgi:hypothetical protein